MRASVLLAVDPDDVDLVVDPAANLVWPRVRRLQGLAHGVYPHVDVRAGLEFFEFKDAGLGVRRGRYRPDALHQAGQLLGEGRLVSWGAPRDEELAWQSKCSAVEHLGWRCLEVLLIARSQAEEHDGQALRPRRLACAHEIGLDSAVAALYHAVRLRVVGCRVHVMCSSETGQCLEEC